MDIDSIIQAKLQQEFTITHLELENQSHLHHGHAGSPGTGHSHYHLKIGAQELVGLSKVQAHRLIYKALSDEMQATIHALSIELI